MDAQERAKRLHATSRRTFLLAAASLSLQACGGGGGSSSGTESKPESKMAPPPPTDAELLASGGVQLVIDRVYTVYSDLLLKKRSIRFLPGGSLRVTAGVQVTLQDCDIDARFSSGSNLAQQIAIDVYHGRFTLVDSRVTVQAADGLTVAPLSDQASPNQFIRTTGRAFYAEVQLLNSSFIAKTTKYISLLTAGFADNAGYENQPIALNITVRQVYVTGFHGVLMCAGVNSATIQGNTFEGNTFSQVGISGQDIQILDNQIIRPGAGGTGDGISGIARLTRCQIVGNRITDGGCYGIWLKADQLDEVLIDDNYISHGITHAIRLSHNTSVPLAWSGVTISSNLITANVGGIAIENADSVALSGNRLQRNFGQFPYQMVIGFGSPAKSEDNRYYNSITEDLTPENLATYEDQGVVNNGFVRYASGW